MHVMKGSRFEINPEKPGSSYAPTPADIAQGLAKLNRWLGMTLIDWTVLQHSLAVYEFFAKRNPDATAKQLLCALWHDAAEFAVGDLPSPHKTTEQKWLENDIQELIYRQSLRITPPSDSEYRAIKAADDELKWAEARTLAHPRAWLAYAKNGVVYDMDAVDIIWEISDVPEYLLRKRFVEITEGLLEHIPRRRG